MTGTFVRRMAGVLIATLASTGFALAEEPRSGCGLEVANPVVAPVLSAPVAGRPRTSAPHSDRAGGCVLVDAGPATYFDVVADTGGTIWAAAARADDTLRLYRSTDFGQTWTYVLWLADTAGILQVEMYAGRGESAFVHVFVLSAAGSGDLWLWRVAPDTSSWQTLPVAVGADTVDDFSATVDRDPNYYLYCLYVNEHRAGRTGYFARSEDYGETWGPKLDWWNAHDPCIIATAGSTIHVAWRYALTGRAINYSYNRHYGAPRYWSWPATLSAGNEKCYDPALVQLDSNPEWLSTLWTFFTVARRDTNWLDLAYAYSPNAGMWWGTGYSLNQGFQDDWAAAIAAGPNGRAAVCYNYGGGRPGDSTIVHWRNAGVLRPASWSSPAIAGTRRTNPAVRPRLTYVRNSPRYGPAVFFSYLDNGELVVTAPWLSTDTAPIPPPELTAPDPVPVAAVLLCHPNPARSRVTVEFTVTAPGIHTPVVYDAAGRRVRTLPPVSCVPPAAGSFAWDLLAEDGQRVKPGAYFVELLSPDCTSRTRLVLLP